MNRAETIETVLKKWRERFGPDIVKNAKYRETEYGPSQSVEEALNIEQRVIYLSRVLKRSAWPGVEP